MLQRESQPNEGLTTAALANANLANTEADKTIEGDRLADDKDPDFRNDRSAVRDANHAMSDSRPVNGSAVAANAAETDQPTPLFSEGESKDFHSRWDAIQVGFVDEPRKAVEQADSLVAAAMQRLAEGFATERSRLEGQWDRGDSVSTEDLRLALRRYRSFFGRLLSV